MSDFEVLYSAINTCTDCGLCNSRTRAVPGEGPENSEILFVGEGPGFNEDQQGRPFVGAAGNFLNELLGTIGLQRSDVYITNVLKCRPPNNRDPLPDEVEACRKYLLRQIELIDPKLVVTLGRFSLGWFFPKDAISRVHGSLRRLGDRHFMHMYHPAAALHAGNMRQVIKDDFLKIPIALEKVREARGAVAVGAAGVSAAQDPTEQGRLF